MIVEQNLKKSLGNWQETEFGPVFELGDHGDLSKPCTIDRPSASFPSPSFVTFYRGVSSGGTWPTYRFNARLSPTFLEQTSYIPFPFPFFFFFFFFFFLFSVLYARNLYVARDLSRLGKFTGQFSLKSPLDSWKSR